MIYGPVLEDQMPHGVPVIIQARGDSRVRESVRGVVHREQAVDEEADARRVEMLMGYAVRTSRLSRKPRVKVAEGRVVVELVQVSRSFWRESRASIEAVEALQNLGSMSIMAMRASPSGPARCPGVKSTLGDFVSMHSNTRLERA